VNHRPSRSPRLFEGEVVRTRLNDESDSNIILNQGLCWMNPAVVSSLSKIACTSFYCWKMWHVNGVTMMTFNWWVASTCKDFQAAHTLCSSFASNKATLSSAQSLTKCNCHHDEPNTQTSRFSEMISLSLLVMSSELRANDESVHPI
jgi:hypothetical protein